MKLVGLSQSSKIKRGKESVKFREFIITVLELQKRGKGDELLYFLSEFLAKESAIFLSKSLKKKKYSLSLQRKT